MDLLARGSRTVNLGHGRRAEYLGAGAWEIVLRVRGRAPRPDGRMTTQNVLRRLPAGSFERAAAERILAAFGDTAPF
jgi:hypothetical protein